MFLSGWRIAVFAVVVLIASEPNMKAYAEGPEGSVVISGVRNSKGVDIFDDHNTYLKTITAEELLHGRDLKKAPIPVIKRDLDHNLLQIDVGGQTVWIDESDVVTSAQKTSNITCTTNLKSHAPDQVTAGVLGISPCTK